MEKVCAHFRVIILSLSVSILIAFGLLVPLAASAASSPQINVWWPTNDATLSGVQPFKAMISGLDSSQYQMFWQVDGGTWNWMDENDTSYPHKETSVDVSGWTWHGSGPYLVNFIARDLSGKVIAQQSETIYVNNGLPNQQAQPQSATIAIVSASVAATPAATSTSQPVAQTMQNSSVSQPAIQSTQNSSVKLYVATNSEAAAQEAAWQTSDPSGAAAMAKLAAQATATWFGNWDSNVKSDVHSLVSIAQTSGTEPVLVAYDIPERDCGGFSSGGSDNPSGYESWIDSFSQGLGQAPAIVVLEPDALAEISCLSNSDQTTREALLRYAVKAIKRDTDAKVYIDAGHSNWIGANTMAQELENSDIQEADGFSLNVSNFMSTPDETTYGDQISSLTGGKHFVIDTSRNGNGSNGQWCNPSNAAIGNLPTTQTGNALVDAYLWVKIPGESDGNCNGGPAAGTWWPSYALSLVQRAR